jgi:ubiquinone/menaquinone biosynthesis C-methylase UbiE
LWDFVSSHGGFAERLQAPVANLVRENLAMREGESVLDVGCGSGSHLATLLEAVGDNGRIVGVDFSPKMVYAARKRVEHQGWRNVDVVVADATRDPLGHADFDAALATFALSAMPDVRAAVENVHSALRPGGRFFVLDLRFAPTGVTAPLTWLLDRLYRLLAARSGEDVLAELDRVFATVEGVAAGGKQRARSSAWPPITLVVATKSAGTTSRD